MKLPLIHPWWVDCLTHGIVPLTKIQYDAQLQRADAGWHCPRCNATAEWCDDIFDASEVIEAAGLAAYPEDSHALGWPAYALVEDDTKN